AGEVPGATSAARSTRLTAARGRGIGMCPGWHALKGRGERPGHALRPRAPGVPRVDCPDRLTAVHPVASAGQALATRDSPSTGEPHQIPGFRARHPVCSCTRRWYNATRKPVARRTLMNYLRWTLIPAALLLAGVALLPGIAAEPDKKA